MTYYNAKLWQAIDDYNATLYFINREKYINSHDFEKIYIRNQAFDFICKNCNISFLNLNYCNLTCDEIIIKKLLE